MPTWIRSSPMETCLHSGQEEVWTVHDGEAKADRSYQVSIRFGKPIDALSLKSPVLSDFKSHLLEIRASRQKVYGSSSRIEEIKRCPICNSSALQSEFQVEVYGARYHQCSSCSHCFILNRPIEQDLEGFYSTNTHFSSYYTDARVVKTRVEEVAVPKVKWVIEEFRRRYGRSPRSVLDVGAGGGHFVHACRLHGLDARGIELNQASREFCRENFGFELEAIDFTRACESLSAIDVVTFWAVIEHVPHPTRLLKSAYQLLSGRPTLVAAEVPRWGGFSTGIQRHFSHTVVRHLDPLVHINVFTDSSLATAFEQSGFAPVAAWYYGLDAYELMMQVSYHVSGDGRLVTESLGRSIPKLQEPIDQGRFSDILVLAGVPKETGDS